MEDSVVNHLLMFLGLYILTVGMIGNILSLIVLCRKRLRTTKIGPYLIALCIADMFALISSNVHVMIQLNHSNLVTGSFSLCKVTYFYRGLASQCPSWLTVVITVERMVCIYRPLANLQWNHNPLAVVSIIVTVLAVLNIANASTLLTMQDGVCIPLWKQHIWFLAATYTYIPSLVLIVCNSVIIYKMYHRPTLGQRTHSRHAGGHTIRLVIAINVLFILTTLPIVLLHNFDKGMLRKEIIFADVVSSLNNSLNFLLYVLFSKVFRQELTYLFQPKSQHSNYELADHENL